MNAVEVSSADIARIAEVRPTAVSNWRKRHDDFPQPIGGTERSPRFELAHVLDWLERQGKTVNRPTDLPLRQAVESASQYMPLASALVQAGLMLLNPVIPKDDKDVVQWLEALRDSQALFTADFPGLATTEMINRDEPTQVAMLRAASQAAANGDGRAIASSLFKHYLEDNSSPTLVSTPQPLARFMVDLVTKSDDVVFDPACQTGDILLAAANHGCTRLAGQESDAAEAMLTALRLTVNAPASRRPPEIERGDSLRCDAFGKANASVVLSHVPFNDRTWGHEELASNQRWEYGPPSSRESELAWVQHALWHLHSGGTAVLVLPPGTASRSSGRRIRRELVARGALRAVLALPRGTLSKSIIGPHLWVLRQPVSPAPRTMLFADLTDQVVSDAVDWETLNRKGNGWWHKYTTTTDFEGDGARAQAIPLTEILDEQVDVTPATHLPVPAAPVWSRERLVHERSALTEKVGRMATKIEELPDRLSLDLDNVDLVTIEELEHSDMLRIRRRRARPELDVSTASDLPVLTPEDIAHHRPPSTRTVVSDGRSPDVVRTGDVLATIVAGRLFARCAAKTDVGAVLGSQLIILRADPRVLSPSYLAGCLSSRFAGQQTERNITSSGIHSASELRRIKIPLPTIAKQATMARLFEELDELAWNLREVNGELAALSDAYKDTFTSAVTSGRHSQSTAGTH